MQAIACATGVEADEVEQTVNAGQSSLSYEPINQTYNYVWKTDQVWAGTCRRFTMVLNDRAKHEADFRFR